MSQSFMASVNSGCHPLPLWKRQIAVSNRWRSAQASNWPRGAKARAVTTSALAGGASSIRPMTIRGIFARSMRRAASPRNAAFRASTSMRVRSRRGHMAASTNPGKPPPLPRSASVFACVGINGNSCAESRTCRVHTSSIVVRPIRFMAFCQRTRVATRISRLAIVSRETSTSSSRIPRANEPEPLIGDTCR